MMKKHLIYLFFLLMAFGACKKNNIEPVIGSVDERLSEALTEYQKLLTGAKFGWKGYLLTGNKISATFLFNFTDKNRTIMSADYTVDNETFESSYRLKSLQRPTLLFDSYSILHLLSDPTPNVAGGSVGQGYFSDFEFAFLSANADTVKLEGTYNQSKLILVKSKSAAESAGVFTENAGMATTLNRLKTYFKRTTLGGTDCEINLDVQNKLFKISYLDGTGLKTVSSSYFVTGNTIMFWDPIAVKDVVITSIKDISYDLATGFINASTSGGTALQIKEAIAPLVYDQAVAARFLANPIYGSYSMSYNGFTVDGIEDAYKVKTIPNFESIDYYHKVGTQAYGAIRFWLSSRYGAYGPAITPTVSADGKISYTLAGSYGTAPDAIAPIIAKFH